MNTEINEIVYGSVRDQVSASIRGYVRDYYIPTAGNFIFNKVMDSVCRPVYLSARNIDMHIMRFSHEYVYNTIDLDK